MNLLALRTEVFAHGFDPVQFGIGRVNQFVNDAYSLICRRVDYYIDESSQTIATVSGTAKYAFPADFARERSLIDTDQNRPLQSVSLNAIDSSSTSQGTPFAYAVDGSGVHLYPTPDGLHNLLMRYWKLPTALVGDTDSPNLPADWHHLLWRYACAECYKAEDDLQTGGAWMQDFNTFLAEFAADQKFPVSEPVSQAASMWDGDESLAGRSSIGYW